MTFSTEAQKKLEEERKRLQRQQDEQFQLTDINIFGYSDKGLFDKDSK